MDKNDKANYLYVNRENHWPDFKWQGLELNDDGSLRLQSLPMLSGKMPDKVSILPIPHGTTGIAIAHDKAVYYSDPLTHRIFKIDPCDARMIPLPCVGGLGTRPTQLNQPRGLLYHRLRKALFVADSDNHRVQIFNTDTFQLLGIWGRQDPAQPALPGSGPGMFNTPWDLVDDSIGNVYVVDYGNQRVQKFDCSGNVNAAFWESIHKQKILKQPANISIRQTDKKEELYILDTQQRKIFVFDLNGPGYKYIREIGDSILQQPMGLVVDEKAVYVGDNGSRKVFKFLCDGTFVGGAHGYGGPVASLTIGNDDSLWLHTGSSKPPMQLKLHLAQVASGVMWGGPFGFDAYKVQWHRLKAYGEWQADGSYIRFFVYKNNTTNPPQLPDFTNPEQPFESNVWESFPLDSVDNLVLDDPCNYLWIGVHMISEGTTSPRLRQIRVAYDHPSYSMNLPAIYRSSVEHREVLERLLALFQSFFEDIEEEIYDLSRYFDPQSVPEPWLSWLADWLGLELNENWSLDKTRNAIEKAYSKYAVRGTALGMKDTIKFFSDVDVHIEEPLLQSAWWVLPDDEQNNSNNCMPDSSILGFNTMLVVAEPQGAVVGTTAILDQSHIIRQEEFGAPLFEDVAHQFCIRVYRGQVQCQEKLDEIRNVIDREKPAHTTYQLDFIEPRMRVGFQARIGIDSIVAGPLLPSTLGKSSTSQGKMVLGGEPPGRIGEKSQIGKNTILGEGAVETIKEK